MRSQGSPDEVTAAACPTIECCGAERMLHNGAGQPPGGDPWRASHVVGVPTPDHTANANVHRAARGVLSPPVLEMCLKEELEANATVCHNAVMTAFYNEIKNRIE